MIVIGTDEAGYGPNLGPLVVSATMWSVPSEDVFETFAAELASKGIRIDDSKKIFRQGSPIGLEQVILPVLRLLKISLPKFFAGLAVNRADEAIVEPDGFPDPVPIFGEVKTLAENVLVLADTLARFEMKLVAVRCRTIFPGEFNRLLDRHDSKGSLLSEATIRLVTEILSQKKPTPPVLVLCDKHGGRNRYLDLLTHHFSDEFFRIVTEGREKSIYRNMDTQQPLEFRFMAKGDSETPVALASMFAKYVRELAMIRLNEFWQRKIPELKPTAGYPEDAKRFKKEIESVQRKLEIDDDTIWRRR